MFTHVLRTSKFQTSARLLLFAMYSQYSSTITALYFLFMRIRAVVLHLLLLRQIALLHLLLMGFAANV